VPVITNTQTTAAGIAHGGFVYFVTATNSPTSFSATGLPAGVTIDPYGLILGVPQKVGTYHAVITAANSYGVSAPFRLTITISAEQPPHVAVTAPTPGAAFAAGSNIALAATAISADTPPVPVLDVTYYAGATRLGTAFLPPYAFTWSAVPAGSYLVTAVATDLLGVSATSSPVAITVH